MTVLVRQCPYELLQISTVVWVNPDELLFPFLYPIAHRSRASTTLPSREKATEQTSSEWLSSVYSGAPVAAFQSRTVWSSDPYTTDMPSEEKATELAEPGWPSSACSAASQSN